MKAEPILKKVYVKDVSFETADSLASSGWKPALKLNIGTKTVRGEGNLFEVTLSLTAQVNNDEKMAYIVEVQQAGLFAIESSDEEALRRVLSCDCPNVLFPYARECVSNLVTRGGFPQMLLNPIDFQQLYEAALAEQKTAEKQ